jgi:hypothetical protein
MTNKNCNKCKESKPLDQFDKDKTSKDGRYFYCKDCRKPWNKKYQARRRELIGEIIKDAKHMEPCVDCSIRYPYYVMQFHHRDPAVKKFNVSDFRRNSGWAMQKLHDEIAKCDILCANCHAERTHQEPSGRSDMLSLMVE